jgi:hypothetical protein
VRHRNEFDSDDEYADWFYSYMVRSTWGLVAVMLLFALVVWICERGVG